MFIETGMEKSQLKWTKWISVGSLDEYEYLLIWTIKQESNLFAHTQYEAIEIIEERKRE